MYCQSGITKIAFPVMMIMIGGNAAYGAEMTVRELLAKNGPMPTFEEHPASKGEKWKVADQIDFSSHPQAEDHKEAIKDGFGSAPNFAHHYVVIVEDCTSPCQMNWIVNKQTGKIIDMIPTLSGVQIRLSSNLLIANPPGDHMDVPVEDHLFEDEKFYVMKDDKLVLIKEAGLIKPDEIGAFFERVEKCGDYWDVPDPSANTDCAAQACEYQALSRKYKDDADEKQYIEDMMGVISTPAFSKAVQNPKCDKTLKTGKK